MTSNTYSYCTSEDVKLLTGVKPKHYGFKQNDTNSEKELEKILEKFIHKASARINKYTKTTFEGDIDETINLACSMIVSNIIAFSQTRRDSPVIKKNDWTIDYVKAEILTDDIKEMLDPFKSEKVDGKSDIDVFTISGD